MPVADAAFLGQRPIEIEAESPSGLSEKETLPGRVFAVCEPSIHQTRRSEVPDHRRHRRTTFDVYRPGTLRRLFLGRRSFVILTHTRLRLGSRRVRLADTSSIEVRAHGPDYSAALAYAATALFVAVVGRPDSAPPPMLVALGFSLAAAINLIPWTTVRVRGKDGRFLYAVWGRPGTLLELTATAQDVRRERLLESHRRYATGGGS